MSFQMLQLISSAEEKRENVNTGFFTLCHVFQVIEASKKKKKTQGPFMQNTFLRLKIETEGSKMKGKKLFMPAMMKKKSEAHNSQREYSTSYVSSLQKAYKAFLIYIFLYCSHR